MLKNCKKWFANLGNIQILFISSNIVIRMLDIFLKYGSVIILNHFGYAYESLTIPT